MARRFGFRRRTQRRLTAWGFGPGSGPVASLGRGPVNLAGTGALQGGQFVAPESEGLTIVRIRGELLANLQPAATVGSTVVVAAGLAIFTQEALAVGGTSLKVPNDDADWDGWMWHQFFALGVTTAAPGGGQDALLRSVRIPIDVKAMRKIDVGMGLQMIIQAEVFGGPAGTTYTWQTRALVKLP